MTTSTDPFDRTLSAWLESLEAEEPTGVTAWVVDRARTTPQRATWLARADLAVGLAPRPGVSADHHPRRRRWPRRSRPRSRRAPRRRLAPAPT